MAEIFHLAMRDVYHDGPSDPGTIPLHAKADFDESLLLADNFDQNEGTYEVVIENQHGRPVLHAWREEDYGNDPWLSVYLDDGSPRWP